MNVRFDVVKKNATIPDTLNLIVNAVNICSKSPYVIELTKQLNPSGSDQYTFIKKVFDFVCRNVPYILDTPGHEQVWTPELTLREGKGDCKKMTTLIASILKCAGIEPVLKHVYYKDSPNTHIYVIVPFPDLNKYLVVDPVNHKMWNTEVTGIASSSLHFLNGKIMELHMMGSPRTKIKARFKHLNRPFPHCIKGIDDDLNALSGNEGNGYMSGVGYVSSAKDEVLANALMGDFGILGLDHEDEVIEGIGRRKRTKEQRKERRKKFKAKLDSARKKAFGFFKKVNLAPSRGAFLLLVRTNIFKLANRMAKAWIHNPEALKNMWKSFGGRPDKLKDAIKAGSKKKPELSSKVNGVTGISGMDTAPGVDQMEEMEVNGTMGEVEGIGSAVAIAAAIAAATPIVVAVIKIIGKSKDDQNSSEDAADVADAAGESAERFSESQEETQGIGFMNDADDIVSGEDYDYIDGMGRKRKKNKKKRERKGKKRREDRKAKKRASKEEGGEGQTEQEAESSEREEKQTKRRIPISNEDITTLSKLAEFGVRKITKGQVSIDDINKFKSDDGGTENTPLAPPVTDSDDIHTPKPGFASAFLPAKPSAGSFGLTQINSLDTFLHWFKGAMVIAFAGAVTYTALSDAIIIGSFLFLVRKPLIKFFTFKK